MYLDAILEVAIGLVITWLVLSIATMQVEEWISGWCRWRAQLLEKSIKRMLNDESLVQDLYHHPSIAALSKPQDKPSYIPSDRFAQTFLDVFVNRVEKKVVIFGLEDVKWIGPKSARSLNEEGIHTIEQLAALDPEVLKTYLEDRYARLGKEEKILQHAKELLESMK